MDCCSHISSRQTIWDLHQGDGDHVDDDDDDQDDGDDDDEQDDGDGDDQQSAHRQKDEKGDGCSLGWP